MKLAYLLSLSEGIASARRARNPFRPTELGPLPFLVTVKPADLTPVRPALDASASARTPLPAGQAGGTERIVLRSAAVLFVMAVIACGFGAQHIAYAKEKNRLGRQLLQRELELRAVTQAYWSLQSDKTLQSARLASQPPPQITKADPGPPTASPKASRATVMRQAKSLKPGGAAFAGQRARVADARPPLRRGGIRG